MSTNPLQVDLYVYPHVININSSNIDQTKIQARAIQNGLHTSRLLRSFTILPTLFELCNIRYSEKQVRHVHENFYDYSLGTRFKLNEPSPTPPRRLEYLIEKFFSGDVSGDIGETLFAYFLIVEMGVNAYHIGHTRPEKRRQYLTPDFVIWDGSFRLASLLDSGNYQLPILAEVKGFTGRVNWTRICHGLGQLKALIANSSLPGILFLAVRNQARRGYDGYVVEVRT